MRKLIFITVLCLIAGVSFAQTLKKGNLIGVHVITVELEEGVTMDEFVSHYNDKYIPEFEKVFEGFQLFIMKGIRGEHKDSIGLLFQIKDEKTRDQYFNDDGSSSELMIKLWEKFAPTAEEINKLGSWSSTYTDWILK
jgi:hypothetical protein